MRRADKLTTFVCRSSRNSVSVKLLEFSGSVQARNGIALTLLLLHVRFLLTCSYNGSQTFLSRCLRIFVSRNFQPFCMVRPDISPSIRCCLLESVLLTIQHQIKQFHFFAFCTVKLLKCWEWNTVYVNWTPRTLPQPFDRRQSPQTEYCPLMYGHYCDVSAVEVQCGPHFWAPLPDVCWLKLF